MENYNPQNILVIDFGQLGDVVLSLPALRAIRDRFPRAHITVAAGKPGAEIVELSGAADATLPVDRVALRDGSKMVALVRIAKLVKQVRKSRYEFIIDLHSLAETNLLGFLSGATKRLYSRRPGRSLDYLANFVPAPPIEKNPTKRHTVDRYLDVLRPLGVRNADRIPRLKTRSDDDLRIEAILQKYKASSGVPLIGLFPGAGHNSRRWPLGCFVQLADYLVRNEQVKPLVFLGPEELGLSSEIRSIFPKGTVILEKLTISQLASAQARLSAFVSNDTGPLHVASAVGTPVVVLLDKDAPTSYLPLGNQHQIIQSNKVVDISVDEAFAATITILTAVRTEPLFAL